MNYASSDWGSAGGKIGGSASGKHVKITIDEGAAGHCASLARTAQPAHTPRR
jgi:hypothetical protein